jgi:hypothetical protein
MSLTPNNTTILKQEVLPLDALPDVENDLNASRSYLASPPPQGVVNPLFLASLPKYFTPNDDREVNRLAKLFVHQGEDVAALETWQKVRDMPLLPVSRFVAKQLLGRFRSLCETIEAKVAPGTSFEL